ncbi:MAG: hypothetical protein CMQ40_12195 [Gammaproteobacteria bacterium]|nr:hypothetical protein [Gammaproteobacteria bacterium]|tara:strand:+ start:188 stop:1315 length:1128 start_codon:yes stop_codon:yes gene_type:complete
MNIYEWDKLCEERCGEPLPSVVPQQQVDKTLADTKPMFDAELVTNFLKKQVEVAEELGDYRHATDVFNTIKGVPFQYRRLNSNLQRDLMIKKLHTTLGMSEYNALTNVVDIETGMSHKFKNEHSGHSGQFWILDTSHDTPMKRIYNAKGQYLGKAPLTKANIRQAEKVLNKKYPSKRRAGERGEGTGPVESASSYMAREADSDEKEIRHEENVERASKAIDKLNAMKKEREGESVNPDIEHSADADEDDDQDLLESAIDQASTDKPAWTAPDKPIYAPPKNLGNRPESQSREQTAEENREFEAYSRSRSHPSRGFSEQEKAEIEHDRQMQEREQQMVDRRHQREQQQREANPPPTAWESTKKFFSDVAGSITKPP